MLQTTVRSLMVVWGHRHTCAVTGEQRRRRLERPVRGGGPR